MMVLVLVACGDSSTSVNSSKANSGEKVKLRVSTGLPDTHQWMIGYFNPFLEEIDKQYRISRSGDMLVHYLQTLQKDLDGRADG